jgi:hypothetical protein
MGRAFRSAYVSPAENRVGSGLNDRLFSNPLYPVPVVPAFSMRSEQYLVRY